MVVIQSAACWISTQTLFTHSSSSLPLHCHSSYLLSGSAAPAFHKGFFIFSHLLLYNKGVLQKHKLSHNFGEAVCTLTRWVAAEAERGRRVIAVCRWRACGFCWLWRLLYVRGWTRMRIGVRLWPCCSETPLLSHSHKLAWLQLDCGLRSPDPDLLRPLVLKTQTHTYEAQNKPNTPVLSSALLTSCEFVVWADPCRHLPCFIQHQSTKNTPTLMCDKNLCVVSGSEFQHKERYRLSTPSVQGTRKSKD